VAVMTKVFRSHTYAKGNKNHVICRGRPGGRKGTLGEGLAPAGKKRAGNK